MNKEQFIAYMNSRLAIIKESERKDIIDEYINHIDMKVQEGMSEEEAIAAFGDIDEMIKEILDAYNIDPRHTRSNNDGFDRKVNEVLDTIFDSFQKLLSSVTSMDVDNIVRLLFEVLVVLVILAFLHIPFEIFASIGSSILRSLFGYGLGSTFGWMWNFVIKLVYVVMFIAVIVNVASRRWSHFRDRSGTPIMDDVKESFNFEQAKEAVHRFTSGTSTTNKTRHETPYKEDEEEILQDIEEEVEEAQAYAYKEYKSYQNHRDYEYQNHSTSGSIIGGLMKFFGVLLMLPFILLMIGLCCALGFLIIMSFQGVSIIGFYFIIIGSIIGCGAIIGIIERSLCKGGRW